MSILNCFFALAAAFFVTIPGLATASDSLTVDAGALAGLRLSVSDNAAAKDYLGLKGSDTFTMPQIKADTVIIEIFSMYCPILPGRSAGGK